MEDDREPRARGKRPPQGEPVIDRAFSLLSAFDAGQRRLSLAELSRRSGIPVSSTLRLAGHLVRWGALERDEDGRYCVGLRLAIYRREEQEVIVAVAAPVFGADDSVAAALGVLLPEQVAQPRRIGLAVRTAAQGISRELGARHAIGLV